MNKVKSNLYSTIGFSTAILLKYADSCGNTRRWKSEILAKGKNEVMDEIKKLLNGKVLYFKKADLPNGSGLGEAYLIPKKVYWDGGAPWVKGDIIYLRKTKADTTIVKTTEINEVVPGITVKACSYKQFETIYKLFAHAMISKSK